MARASAEHEEVPDGVVVGQTLDEVEKSAHGVDESPGQEPGEPPCGQGVEEGPDGEDCEPPHQDVGDRGQDLEPVDEEDLEDNPRGGQHPDQPEQGPSPASLQRHEREGRVGPGDQQVDARVVDDLENVFQPRRADGVVERRGRVEEHQGCTEDAAAHEMKHRAVLVRKEDEHTEPRCAQESPRAVGEAVDEFFNLNRL